MPQSLLKPKPIWSWIFSVEKLGKCQGKWSVPAYNSHILIGAAAGILQKAKKVKYSRLAAAPSTDMTFL